MQKNQPLLGTNEKKPKMSVRTLPGALQFMYDDTKTKQIT